MYLSESHVKDYLVQTGIPHPKVCPVGSMM